MKTAIEVYSVTEAWADKTDYFYGPIDYLPMLNEFGYIAILTSDNGYSGDTWVFYSNGKAADNYGKCGYLQVGWGSCSGCDALQGCDSREEVQKLMDELYLQVMWFDDYIHVLKYFKEHDWDGDWSSGVVMRDLFIQAVIKYCDN